MRNSQGSPHRSQSSTPSPFPRGPQTPTRPRSEAAGGPVHRCGIPSRVPACRHVSIQPCVCIGIAHAGDAVRRLKPLQYAKPVGERYRVVPDHVFHRPPSLRFAGGGAAGKMAGVCAHNRIKLILGYQARAHVKAAGQRDLAFRRGQPIRHAAVLPHRESAGGYPNHAHRCAPAHAHRRVPGAAFLPVSRQRECGKRDCCGSHRPPECPFAPRHRKPLFANARLSFFGGHSQRPPARRGGNIKRRAHPRHMSENWENCCPLGSRRD